MEIPKNPELDLLVEERVFGRKFDGDVPCYNNGMKWAWAVVERLRDLHASWTKKVSELLPEAMAKFSDLSDETKISFGNDVEEYAAELAGPKPVDIDVFFEKLRRFTGRPWPHTMLYLTPDIVCRAAVAAFPPKD